MASINHYLRCALLLSFLGAAPSLAKGQSVVREGFEGPETTWQDAGGDARYRIDSITRVQSEAHSGRWSERIRVKGDNGSYVYIAHDIGEARVIAELQPSLWIKADRPGLQLLARAVLPRSKDPKTGKPITTLLRGSGYTQSGSWQQLKLDASPPAIERQVRALRAELGPNVDPREAYLDRLILNVYGGPGSTEVYVDDLELPGFVGRAPITAPPIASDLPKRPDSRPDRLPETWNDGAPASTGVAETRLNGSVLMVNGKSTFARVIRYRGESLEFLRRIGFNAVQLDTPPTDELLKQAKLLGVWLVAPPPSSRDLENSSTNPLDRKIGRQWDAVVAWNLGEGLSTRQLQTTKHWAKVVRSADPQARPLICSAESELRAYSRQVDLLLARRSPVYGSLELADYARWLRERPQLARPGTPFWTAIPTQPSDRFVAQISALEGIAPTIATLEAEQLRLMVYTALAAEARGLCFDSATSLESPDAATQLRAATLELLNLELDLIEPWCAGGSQVTTASCSDTQLLGAVMQMQRARLLLPLSVAPHNQFVVGGGTEGVVSFVVPGAPESNDAFQLTPSGLKPLAHRRVAGGIRVAFADGEPATMAVLTQDPLVVSTLTRRIAKIRHRGAQLQREIAARSLSQTEEIDRRLTQQGRALRPGQNLLPLARQSLVRCDTLISASDDANSFLQSTRALQQIQATQRSHWNQAASEKASPLNNPLMTSFATLPSYWRLATLVNTAGRGPNQLVGGEFEDLNVMMQAGWQHFQHPQAGITTDVDLAPDGAHGGRFALRLRATAPKETTPTTVETSPLWVTSAPIEMQQGQLFEIRGWLKIAKPIAGSVDGLMIFESLTGEALAERFQTDTEWQEFTLLRVATESGPIAVTFALSGLGEAWLDDVSVQAIDPSKSGGRPPASPADMAIRAPARPIPTKPPVQARANNTKSTKSSHR